MKYKFLEIKNVVGIELASMGFRPSAPTPSLHIGMNTLQIDILVVTVVVVNIVYHDVLFYAVCGRCFRQRQQWRPLAGRVHTRNGDVHEKTLNIFSTILLTIIYFRCSIKP